MATPIDHETYNFLTGDFEALWDALAGSTFPNRANFTFAFKAMVLLEWASSLCARVPGSGLRADFSQALCDRDPRYFTRLPGLTRDQVWVNPANTPLPIMGAGDPHEHVLWVMFDLIRNGHGHQYRQFPARLQSGEEFFFSITGPNHPTQQHQPLALWRAAIATNRRAISHLSHARDQNSFAIVVDSAALYLDVKHAIDEAGVLQRTPPTWTPTRVRPAYPLTGDTLDGILTPKDGGPLPVGTEGR